MFIPLANLAVSAENPRVTPSSQAEDAMLAASLKAHGQLTPILVRHDPQKKDHFVIIEGGRRFRLAEAAGLEGLNADLYEGSMADAEIGTAANQARARMHPLDEAATIARRMEDGETAEDIAVRFGRDPRWVNQRVRLHQLCERAKKLLRAGSLSLAAAEALTIASPGAQNGYLKAAHQDWQLEPRHIRDHFNKKDIAASIALFDLKDYPQDKIRADLFNEDVWLTDRKAFEKLQLAALEAKVEVLKAEGWAEASLVIDPTYEFSQQNVRVDGEVKAKDRARFNAFVVYSTNSGRVREERGYTTLAEMKRLAREKAKGSKKKTAQADDVEARTAFELSESQQVIAGALATRGIADAIAAGDTWLALKTILSPLFSSENKPSWCGLTRSMPNFINVNTMLDDGDKIEPRLAADRTFPSRVAFDKMSWEDVFGMIRQAALHTMSDMRAPHADALKILKETGTPWFRYTAGFLRRYRLDALQDLARHLKVPSDGLKKTQLIAKIIEKKDELTFCPVRPEADRE